MLFRKNAYQKIEDAAAKLKVEPDRFLRIPGLGCKIAEKTLEFPNREPMIFNFAEAQLLTKRLSNDYKLDIRMPKTMEGYIASHKLSIGNHQYEWRSELIDGSFLMFNPEVRSVDNPRKYDFSSNNTSLIDTSKYIEPKNNGSLCWLGISRDHHDRAAFASNFDNEKYSICAVPPLSRDCLLVRLLIDENKKKKYK